MLDRVSFSADGVHFARYPYPGALVFPAGLVPWSEIRHVDPDATPPEIRTGSGEVLFVSAELREELRSAAAQHGVAVIGRVDVWGLLLEPFVDTEFGADHQAATIRELGEVGLDASAVQRLRDRFEARMLAYNALHWDWTHLGQADLLDAHLRRFVPRRLAIAHRRFVRLYRESMEIAALGEPGRSND